MDFISFCQQGNTQIVQEMLNNTNIEMADQNGMTGLHYASIEGHYDIVQLLVSNGANVNKQNHTGFTPLFGAASHGHRQIVDYLIQKGADYNHTVIGWNILCAACYSENLEFIQYLVQNYGIPCAAGVKASEFAHIRGNEEISQYLNQIGG